MKDGDANAPDNGKDNPHRRRYLGEILVTAGLVDKKTLAEALRINKETGKKIGRVLSEMGAVDDVQIARALADQLSIRYVDLSSVTIPKDTLALVSEELVKNHTLIPIENGPGYIMVAMANPLDFYAVDDLRFVTQLRVEIATAPEDQILDAINLYYGGNDFLKIPEAFSDDSEGVFFHRGRDYSDDLESVDSQDLAGKAPIIKFTNVIIGDAIKQGASDVHIEPDHNSVVVRYRIDGVMREIMKTTRRVHSGVITRIKVMSKMDITVRRKPQDGKCKVVHKGNTYDLRISTLPTGYGEKITVRILSPLAAHDSIEDLGLSDLSFKDLKRAIGQPQGIVLVTGPTGSGKTTTLYSCLKSRLSPEINIVTLENPIEYDVRGINQVEINPAQGLTFAEGLRSILRQDPDIVMVGEIRDKETAEIAFHAAQTGHLVFSTLHTNNALATLTRLFDLGIAPFNISTSLTAIVAQRLVRKLCAKCKVVDPMSDKVLENLPSFYQPKKGEQFFRSEGCDNCNFSGYQGRLGIHEVLYVTGELRQLIARNTPLDEIEKAALKGSFRYMSLDGLKKAAEGLTSVSEVYRVAPPPDEGRLVEESLLTEQEEMEQEQKRAERMPSVVRNQGPKRIVVAEDDEPMLRLLQGILEGEGYDITTARDGGEAFELINRNVPDLLVTDVVMPAMDGISLIKKLRKQLATAYVPIIIISTHTDTDVEVEGINAGADDFMSKPINARRLIARVNRLLKQNIHN